MRFVNTDIAPGVPGDTVQVPSFDVLGVISVIVFFYALLSDQVQNGAFLAVIGILVALNMITRLGARRWRIGQATFDSIMNEELKSR